MLQTIRQRVRLNPDGASIQRLFRRQFLQLPITDQVREEFLVFRIRKFLHWIRQRKICGHRINRSISAKDSLEHIALILNPTLSCQIHETFSSPSNSAFIMHSGARPKYGKLSLPPPPAFCRCFADRFKPCSGFFVPPSLVLIASLADPAWLVPLVPVDFLRCP